MARPGCSAESAVLCPQRRQMQCGLLAVLSRNGLSGSSSRNHTSRKGASKVSPQPLLCLSSGPRCLGSQAGGCSGWGPCSLPYPPLNPSPCYQSSLPPLGVGQLAIFLLRLPSGVGGRLTCLPWNPQDWSQNPGTLLPHEQPQGPKPLPPAMSPAHPPTMTSQPPFPRVGCDSSN